MFIIKLIFGLFLLFTLCLFLTKYLYHKCRYNALNNETFLLNGLKCWEHFTQYFKKFYIVLFLYFSINLIFITCHIITYFSIICKCLSVNKV